MEPERAEVVIVGAGVAGLACAAELARLGRDTVVLERSRGIGGRCATRRVEGQPVDHGVAFLHGSDRGFLDALAAVPTRRALWGWPERVEGEGTPCQPQSFHELESRVAFAEGVNAFPRALARGLDIRRETEVVDLTLEDGTWRARSQSGRVWAGDDLVLAIPAPQMAELVGLVEASVPELLAARYLLQMSGSHPCLTVLAGYAPETPVPSWQMAYPETSTAIQLMARDSTKRVEPEAHVFVYQAHPSWSRAHLSEPPEGWSQALLAEAARLAGRWAESPLWSQAHRWRYARADRGMELSHPMLMQVAGRARLGLAGEIFAPGTGVQAAWISGRELAQRLVGEAPAPDQE